MNPIDSGFTEIEEPDPIEDRDEFERRLRHIFEDFSPNQQMTMIRALLNGDVEEVDNCKATVNGCESKIQGYLSQWDEARNSEEREIIVSSVRKSE